MRNTIILILIYFCLGLFGLLNHAMWRDELNVWLLVRDSNSLWELFHNLKYEGHPGLWYICLAWLNQFTDNPVIMQMFHLLLATGSVALFVIYSPFTKLQKILFTFGYLPIYEYLLISRNYAIGILLVFAFCALFEQRHKGYLLLAIILFLMANTNAYCLFIATALGITLILEYLLGRRIGYTSTASNTKSDMDNPVMSHPVETLHATSLQGFAVGSKRGWSNRIWYKLNLLGSIMIFCLGIVSSIAQMIPPNDSTLQGGLNLWRLQFDPRHLAMALTRIWSSYLPIITPADSKYLDVVVFALISLILLLWVSTMLRQKPVAWLFYSLGTLEMLFFTYAKFLGSARHYGHLYIILIVALWLASYYPQSDFLIQPLRHLPNSVQQGITRWFSFVAKYKNTLIMLILASQVATGMVAFSRDLFVPYSASRETAQFIQLEQLDKMFIVGSQDARVSPIAGYLQRQIYYPESQALGSFVLFNNQRTEVNSAMVLEQVSQLLQQQQTETLLILNYELDSSRVDLSISPLAQFTNSFIHDEKYYLYILKPSDTM
ncbi:MAG: hypothetical protein F6K47_09545 [Symploca sp. SIO2E6]|nr:hypothetical protein [Symploca sp. SIO2E6]